MVYRSALRSRSRHRQRPRFRSRVGRPTSAPLGTIPAGVKAKSWHCASLAGGSDVRNVIASAFRRADVDAAIRRALMAPLMGTTGTSERPESTTRVPFPRAMNENPTKSPESERLRLRQTQGLELELAVERDGTEPAMRFDVPPQSLLAFLPSSRSWLAPRRFDPVRKTAPTQPRNTTRGRPKRLSGSTAQRPEGTLTLDGMTTANVTPPPRRPPKSAREKLTLAVGFCRTEAHRAATL